MVAQKFNSKVIELDDSLEAFYDWAMREGVGDGLPLIPPTTQRVEAMAAASRRPLDEEIGVIKPQGGRATIEKLAINAVMAGCLPEHFPVVVAGIKAMLTSGAGGEPAMLEGMNTTTNASGPGLIINGPIRNRINVNSNFGCLGPGWRANATIGRTIRLLMINLGGSIPGGFSRTAQAWSGRYTLCFGEREEDSPWEPLHIERGFRRDEDVVTAITCNGSIDVVDGTEPDEAPEGLLTLVAQAIQGAGAGMAAIRRRGAAGSAIVLFGPDQAQFLAKRGWTKQRVKEFLVEKNSRIPLSWWPEDRHERMKREGYVVDGTVAVMASPEQVTIVVAGGDGGLHTAVGHGRAGGSARIG